MNDITKTPASHIADTSPVGWLRSEIDRLFDDFGRPARSIFNFAPRGLSLVPALELTDDGKAYKLTAELPGLSEKDIDIRVTGDILTISGEKKVDEERKEDGFLLSERRYGSFARQITLPKDVDPNTIAAKFKDGVLSLTLAKDERAAQSSRKITIEQ